METVTENKEIRIETSKYQDKQTVKRRKWHAAEEQNKAHCASFRFFRIPTLLLTAYTMFMLYLLFLRNRDGLPADPDAWRREQLNLIPLCTVAEYLADLRPGNSAEKIRNAVINLGGNIGLFIPFGFLIPFLFRKFRSLFRTLLLMSAAVAAVEVLQLLTCRGHCDVDDLILNLAGVSLGYLLFLCRKKFQNVPSCPFTFLI